MRQFAQSMIGLSLPSCQESSCLWLLLCRFSRVEFIVVAAENSTALLPGSTSAYFVDNLFLITLSSTTGSTGFARQIMHLQSTANYIHSIILPGFTTELGPQKRLFVFFSLQPGVVSVIYVLVPLQDFVGHVGKQDKTAHVRVILWHTCGICDL